MDHDTKFKTWLATTGTLLVSIDSRDCQAYSIPIVPEELRKWNEKAYEPKVVSIGPRFNGRRELLPMEEIKWHYMMTLLYRTQDPLTSLKSCMELALSLDATVRASYMEIILQDNYDLATIMVRDSCFLLELLISGSQEFDSILPHVDPIGPEAVRRDLPPGPSAEGGEIKAVSGDLPPPGPSAEGGEIKAVSGDLPPGPSAEGAEGGEIKAVSGDLPPPSPSAEGAEGGEIKAVSGDLPPGPSTESEKMKAPAVQTDLLYTLRYDTGEFKAGKMKAILSDIALLENQIPFFILAKFFRILFPSDRIEGDVFEIIEKMALHIFIYFPECQVSDSRLRLFNAAHFLQFVRSSFLIQVRPSNLFDYTKLNRCATRLHAAGVRIQSLPSTVLPKFNHGFDSFVRTSEIDFQDEVLAIPTLVITETMEAMWRNFIAWEHQQKKWNKKSNYGSGDVFTFYALLFNDLICCTGDVQLLKNKGIIRDELGMRKRDLVHLFGSIANGVDHCLVNLRCHDTIDKLNDHRPAIGIEQYSIIVRHHLTRITEWLYGRLKFFWRGYNFVISLATILTAVQTVYAVLSYHHPKQN